MLPVAYDLSHFLSILFISGACARGWFYEVGIHAGSWYRFCSSWFFGFTEIAWAPKHNTLIFFSKYSNTVGVYHVSWLSISHSHANAMQPLHKVVQRLGGSVTSLLVDICPSFSISASLITHHSYPLRRYIREENMHSHSSNGYHMLHFVPRLNVSNRLTNHSKLASPSRQSSP